MKVFKTERIIYFNSKLPKKPNKIIKTPQSFLSKKLCLFKVEKYDEYFENELEGSYKGRWTLKEHILFLQAIDRYGVNWKKIRKVVKTIKVYKVNFHKEPSPKRFAFVNKIIYISETSFVSKSLEADSDHTTEYILPSQAPFLSI